MHDFLLGLAWSLIGGIFGYAARPIVERWLGTDRESMPDDYPLREDHDAR